MRGLLKGLDTGVEREAAPYELNVVDPSVWLEYFPDGAYAYSFACPIENIEALVVPR